MTRRDGIAPVTFFESDALAQFMTATTSTSIRAGRLDGRVFWDSGLQSFAVLLELFDHQGTYPPPVKRIGLRPGEFITPDALANHLHGCGLTLDGASLGAMADLGRFVCEVEGSAEIVGLVDPEGHRHLFVATPSRLVLRAQPSIDHPAYRFQWGDNGPATVETARVICERVFVRSPAQDIDTFALALTVEYLADIEGDFSFDANALCDWYLTDSPLSSGLDLSELVAIRRRMELGQCPPLPA
jgi:hypothetical protein